MEALVVSREEPRAAQEVLLEKRPVAVATSSDGLRIRSALGAELRSCCERPAAIDAECHRPVGLARYKADRRKSIRKRFPAHN